MAFSLKDRSRFDEYDLADSLRQFGWIVPAYTMAPDAEKVQLLRVVVREDFSRTLAKRLLEDVERTVVHLAQRPPRAVLVEAQKILKEREERGEETSQVKKGNGAPSSSSSSSSHSLRGTLTVLKAWQRFKQPQGLKKTNGVC